MSLRAKKIGRNSLCRNRRGGVMVEYAVSALFLVIMLFSVIEFSLEMYIRQSTERATDVASRVYSVSRSVEAAEDAVEIEVSTLLNRCLQPIEFRIYDAISGVDVSDPNTGRVPAGDASDDTAIFARISVQCDWERITPVVRSTFGASMVHRATVLVRLRP
jgi:hypothetical protein